MKLKAKDYILVGLQLFLFSLFIFEIGIVKFKIPELIRGIAVGMIVTRILILAIALLQLNKNLSPFPTPKTGSQLIQTGLYKFIRHPIYTGILISLFGYSIYSSSIFRLVLTLSLYALFIIKTRYEEKLLLERYDDYASYRKRTGRFFPKVFNKN